MAAELPRAPGRCHGEIGEPFAPGDTLRIEILSLDPGDWGWTAIVPEFGLLPGDFPSPFLKIFDLRVRDSQSRRSSWAPDVVRRGRGRPEREPSTSPRARASCRSRGSATSRSGSKEQANVVSRSGWWTPAPT